MIIQPINDRILVKPIKAEEKMTRSGFILTSASQEKPQFSEVVAVGSETDNLKVGDKVIICKYSGSEIRIDNEDYALVKYEDILAVVKEG